MKNYVIAALAVLAVIGYIRTHSTSDISHEDNYIPQEKIVGVHKTMSTAIEVVKLAPTSYTNHFSSGAQVNGIGSVIRVLPDDNKGSRHQKFIIRLDSGKTLLVAHNIDLAPRIRMITEGDNIEFYGVFEPNAKGGVIHWTHKDPNRRHIDGWLKHNGRTYQ